MEENLKQKLNNLTDLKWYVISTIVCLYTNCAFAASEENLSDEFFNAAMQVEAPEKYNGITSSIKTGTAAEQAMAAEQIGEEAISSGNNVLQGIKTFFQNANDSIKDFGSSISGNISPMTGENTFMTKILVVFALVAISIIIIVILGILAKKFVFQKKNLAAFETEEENIDNLNPEVNENFSEEDYQEDFEEQNPKQEKQNISHTIIPPKSQIEYSEPPINENIEENIQTQIQPEQPVQIEEIQPQTVFLNQNPALRIAEPKDVQSAMKVFLKVTAE